MRFRTLVMALLFFAAHLSLAAPSPRLLLESSAVRFLINRTLPGAELVARATGVSGSLVEGHLRLRETLRGPGMEQLGAELRLRLGRVRERFERKFPARARAVFEGGAPLVGHEEECLSALAADELDFWQFSFVNEAPAPTPADGLILYNRSRELFSPSSDLRAQWIVETSLLGVEYFPPESQAFHSQLARVRALRVWADFPTVSQLDVGVLAPFAADGLGNLGMFSGKLPAGQEIVVKLSNPATRSQEQLLNEARFFLILNKLGLGPKFHGLISFPSGNYGIVTDRIPGVPYPPVTGRALPLSFPVQESHAASMIEAGKLMARAGIKQANDLQFILTPEGRAVVIDPEFLSFEAAPASASEPVRRTEVMARSLRREIARRAPAPGSSSQAPDIPEAFRQYAVPLIGESN